VVIPRRVKLVLLGLLAPGFVLLWAIRQLLGARELAKSEAGGFIISYKAGVLLMFLRAWMDTESRIRHYGRLHALQRRWTSSRII